MPMIVRFGLLALLLAALALASCNKQTGSAEKDAAGRAVERTADTPETPASDKPVVAEPGTTATAVVGQRAPDFTLTDLNGQQHSLSQHLAAGNTVVLEWFNPGCSVVHFYYQESTAMADTFAQAQQAMGGKLVWLAIVSQDPSKHGGTTEDLTKAVADWGITYPILRDESGTVGKSYGMQQTPAIAIISPDGTLQYSGGVDEFSKGGGNPPIGTNYVVQAVSELASSKPVSVPSTKAVG